MATLQPAMPPPRSSRQRGRVSSEITIGLSPSLVDALGQLSDEMRMPVEGVLTEAVALLLLAVEAQKKGQRICLADDDLNIVGEIDDFGLSRREIDAEPPDSETDRLDS